MTGGSACEGSTWMSSSAVGCRAVSGFGRGSSRMPAQGLPMAAAALRGEPFG